MRNVSPESDELSEVLSPGEIALVMGVTDDGSSMASITAKVSEAVRQSRELTESLQKFADKLDQGAEFMCSGPEYSQSFHANEATNVEIEARKAFYALPREAFAAPEPS
jgi:hypothetical protein